LASDTQTRHTSRRSGKVEDPHPARAAVRALSAAAAALSGATDLDDVCSITSRLIPAAVGCESCAIVFAPAGDPGRRGAGAPTGLRTDLALDLHPSGGGPGELRLYGSAGEACVYFDELCTVAASLVSGALNRAMIAERAGIPVTLGDLSKALGNDMEIEAALLATKLGIPTDYPCSVVAVGPNDPALQVAAGVGDRPPVDAASALAEAERALAAAFPGAVAGPIAGQLMVVIPGSGESVECECEGIGSSLGVCVGIAGPGTGLRALASNLNSAARAALACRMLYREGGVIHDEKLGAYRLLVDLDHASFEDDRLYVGVSKLARYDSRHVRPTDLLLTLETYLEQGKRPTASARALYVHPNTLRQRVQRIEAISGLNVDAEDQMSLEIAVKLVRLRMGIPPPRR
jgi:hypothetical protein